MNVRRLTRIRLFWGTIGMLAVGACAADLRADDPPALNPFGKNPAARDDAIPGSCTLSDGRVLRGKVYLTRDHRLKIYDEQLERQREVPLAAVRKIECVVEKEWLEKEWRFKENANDEKFFTGRTYPCECHHTITLATVARSPARSRASSTCSPRTAPARNASCFTNA